MKNEIDLNTSWSFYLSSERQRMMKLNEEYVVGIISKKIITRTTILEHRYEEKHSKTKKRYDTKFRNLQMEHESNPPR